MNSADDDVSSNHTNADHVTASKRGVLSFVKGLPPTSRSHVQKIYYNIFIRIINIYIPGEEGGNHMLKLSFRGGRVAQLVRASSGQRGCWFNFHMGQ